MEYETSHPSASMPFGMRGGGPTTVTRAPIRASAWIFERAEVEAEVPVGFLASITKRQEGAELTEMVELAERGAAGFSDDGRPVEVKVAEIEEVA